MSHENPGSSGTGGSSVDVIRSSHNPTPYRDSPRPERSVLERTETGDPHTRLFLKLVNGLVFDRSREVQTKRSENEISVAYFTRRTAFEIAPEIMVCKWHLEFCRFFESSGVTEATHPTTRSNVFSYDIALSECSVS